MSWIQERLDERKRAQEDWAAIDINAAQTYEALWREIGSLVTEAATLGIPVSTNGGPLARTVFKSKNLAKFSPIPQQPEELTVTLQRDKHIIAAQSHSGTVDLKLSLCAGRIVCLKHNNNEVSIEEAVRMILEPFLFPPDAPLF